jgi:hypothetical protein
LVDVRDAKKVTLWQDECAAQNKNWAPHCFLVYIVNSEEIDAEKIVLKYFEPGHSFMSAYSFHHQVEKSLKAKGKIYDFDDFCSSVEGANGGNVKVKAMKIQDFSNWQDEPSSYKLNRHVLRAYLSDMVMVRALRGRQTLVYRSLINGLYVELNFLAARPMKVGIEKPHSRSTERGIPVEKRMLFCRSLEA